MSARVLLSARLPDLLTDDRGLLARFADHKDEAAFAAIVKRYGPMVLGVCRRAVRDAHLAEDAFQAVFLVLARNPGAASAATSIGGWLFGVARRVGSAARRHELRREKRTRKVRPNTSSQAAPPRADWDDLLRVLDEELAAIPDEYRDPLIACFLREQTQDEAARELGWSLSTLRRRLERGKELLRARLSRRNATLSAGLFAGLIAPSTASAIPRSLADRIAHTVTGNAPTAPLVTSLVAAGLATGIGAKLITAIGVLLLGGLAIGLAWPGESVAEPSPPPSGIATPGQEFPPGVLPTAVSAAPVPHMDWVTVTGRVTFPNGRTIPKPREITRTDEWVKSAECCFAGGRRLFIEDILIDPDTRGIRNVVVWLRSDAVDRKTPFPPQKIHPSLREGKPKEHVVDVIDCQFRPRVTVARTGDTLRFDNTSPLVLNVKYNAMHLTGPGRRFDDFNILLPANRTSYQPKQPLLEGTSGDRFESNVYPWMKGHVWAFDHPYATVTDAEGRFTIPNAPVGAWRLVLWQEVGGWSTESRPIPDRAKPLGFPVTLPPVAGRVIDLGVLIHDSDLWANSEKE
jgi:RNA polymerase sigma factor (sigma-70 family)